MSFAIGLVDKAALWATSAGVARINGDNRNASELRLLGHELAKLTERPAMQTAALRLLGLNSIGYVRKVFNRNRKMGALRLAPLVQRRAVLLNGGKALASTLDLNAGVRPALAIKGEVDDAKVVVTSFMPPV